MTTNPENSYEIKRIEPLTMVALFAASPMAGPSIDVWMQSGGLVVLKQTSKVSPCPGLQASRKLSKYLKAGATGGLSSCRGSHALGSLKSQATLLSCPKNWNSCSPSCSRLGSGNMGMAQLRSVQWAHASPVLPHTSHRPDDDMAVVMWLRMASGGRERWWLRGGWKLNGCVA